MDKYINMRSRFSYSPFPDYMFKNKNVSWAAKCCYCRLIHYAQVGKDDRCFPSQKTLSEDMNLSTRQIYSLIQELVTEGYIDIKKATGRDILDHVHDEYLFLNHPSCIDTFSEEKFSSSQDQNTLPGRDRGMSSDYINNIKKEDLSFSKEKDYRFQKESELKPLLKKRQNKVPDRSLFKNLAPKVPLNKEKKILKPSVAVYSILDFWKNSGLHSPKETTKAHIQNIESLNQVLNGKKFEKEYTKEQILASIKNFAIAATNLDYSPVKKSYFQKLYLHDFIFNPFGTNGDRSLFLHFLDNPPELLAKPVKSIPAKNPALAKAVKNWYLQNVLGDVKVEFTPWDENNFIVSSNKILEFYEKNKSNLRLGLSSGIFDFAKLACEAVKADSRGDTTLIDPSWLQSDKTFSIRIPKYLKARDMLITKWRV